MAVWSIVEELREDLGEVTTELDLESLRPATTYRFRLQLTEDGAGFPLSVPVLVARGKSEGPVLGVLAALHGNEINGIPVIHRLFERMEASRLAGTVIGVLVANYPSFERRQRRFIDGIDLNHMMPGRADGNTSHVYAHRLLDRVVRHFNHMIDLHTASGGRANSLYARADMLDENSATLAKLLRPQIILHNPPRDGTLRGAAEDLGIPAVTLEIGNPQRFQPEFIRSAVRGIRWCMMQLDMLKAKPGPATFDYEPIICNDSFWMYTDRGGLLTVHPKLCARLQHGEPLATLRNIFGDITAEYTMPVDGVIIGKAMNPVGHTGARIAHIGIEGGVDAQKPARAKKATTKSSKSRKAPKPG